MEFIGLSIIIRNENEYNKARDFIGLEYCYMEWVSQMAEHETAIVVFADIDSHFSTGSIGSSTYQKDNGLRLVEFSDYFKIN
jgi:hypothetical protein